VKRSLVWTASVLALATAVYCGSRLGAKPTPAPAPAPTRVALLNIRSAVKNYVRYQRFMEGMKKLDREYLEAVKAKQKKLEALNREIEALQGAARADKEQQALVLRREVEDLTTKFRREAAEKGQAEMVVVYKQIRDAATKYARAHQIDLVLHFEGPSDKDDVDSTELITRMMNAGGATPLYFNPSLDITGPVVETLNDRFQRGDL
jgi:Skp family chaperone for outer membrane proteins